MGMNTIAMMQAASGDNRGSGIGVHHDTAKQCSCHVSDQC